MWAFYLGYQGPEKGRRKGEGMDGIGVDGGNVKESSRERRSEKIKVDCRREKRG